MQDKLEILGKGSLIQHGNLNQRIYLMKLDKQDASIIIDKLSALAHKNSYSKIFCKIPKWVAPLFISDGYLLEASIPKFYNDTEDVFFVSKFVDANRLQEVPKEALKSLSNLLEDTATKKKTTIQPNTSFELRKLEIADAEKIASIYKEVFISYPFPIHDPKYITQTMSEDVQYYGAIKSGKIVAVASSEMDVKGCNAEMTDFATDPAFLGNNLSVLLLNRMEEAMKEQGIKTLYTIARLNSIPMNKTFLKFDYRYSGTLINNTNIAGSIESMNVYYKNI